MQIVCGYVPNLLQPRTSEAIYNYAPNTQFLDFTGDDFGYWRAIADRWNGVEDLILIEQDIVINENVLPAFASCKEPWCAFSYSARPGLRDVTGCLGCVKFSAEFQDTFPVTGWPKRIPWVVIDINIGKRVYLEGNGHYKPHIHGTVEHLHPYDPSTFIGQIEVNDNGIYQSNEFTMFTPPIMERAGSVEVFGSEWEKFFLAPAYVGPTYDRDKIEQYIESMYD